MGLALRARLSELARVSGGRLVGCDVFCQELRSLELAGGQHLAPIFAPLSRRVQAELSKGGQEAPGALLVDETWVDALEGEGRPLIVHHAPRLALLGILESFCRPEPPMEDAWLSEAEVVGIHGPAARTSSIHRSARVSSSASLQGCVVIDRDAEIGAGARIAAGAFIGPRVQIGPGCEVGEGAVVGCDGFARIAGPDGHVDMPHWAGVVLGEGCRIGPRCTIAAGLLEATSIGARARLDASVHVGHNCSIGSDCVVAAQVGFSGTVRIGDRCRIGGQAGFADHLTLGDDCQVAARAGVTKSWPAGSVLGGFPAEDVSHWRRRIAASRRGRTPAEHGNGGRPPVA